MSFIINIALSLFHMLITEKVVRWLNWRYDGAILIYNCTSFEWVKSNQIAVFYVPLFVKDHPFLQQENLEKNTNVMLTEKNINSVLKKYFGLTNFYLRDCETRKMFDAYRQSIHNQVKLNLVGNVYPKL